MMKNADDMEGSPQRELFLIQFIFFLSLLIRNVSIPWIFLGNRFNSSKTSYWLKFTLDFGFMAVPGLLSLTLCSSSLHFIAISLLACLFTCLVFVICEYFMSRDRLQWRRIIYKIVDEHHGPTTFITYFRSTMLILVSIAILAVDFPIFPERFRKTERYGHSLMDIGVAAFVVSASIGSRLKTSSMIEGKEKQKRWWALTSSYVVLPAIGLVRTAVICGLGYHQPVTEYGVHWNFFYTMAVIRIVTHALPKKFPLVFALVFGSVHQFILSNGMEEWILYGENARETFVTANIEGIVSLLGYITLHYICKGIADFIAETGIRVKSWLECCFRLFALSIVFFLLQMASEWIFGPPSRRVVNVTYLMAQLSLLIFALACFLTIQMFNIVTFAANAPHYSADDNPFSGLHPCLADSVNKKGLIFFLMANVITGAINIFLEPMSFDDTSSFTIIAAYSLTLCFVVHYISSPFKWSS